MQDHPIITWTISLASAGTIISTVLGWLPPIAAGAALFWYYIQISESEKVRRWVQGRRIRKLARLKATALMLEAKLKQAETPNPLEN